MFTTIEQTTRSLFSLVVCCTMLLKISPNSGLPTNRMDSALKENPENSLKPNTAETAPFLSGLRRLRVQLLEEEPIGREVANLRFLAEGWTHHHRPADGQSAIRPMDNFQMFNSEPQSNFFKIDPKSGILRISRRIDRDQLCPQFLTCCPKTQAELPMGLTEMESVTLDSGVPVSSGGHLPACRLDLNVRSDDQYSRIILVHVHIIDINDNSPVWLRANGLAGTHRNEVITIRVNENSLVDDSVILPSAHDADTDVNSIARYTLIPDTPEFTLRWTSEYEMDGVGTLAGRSSSSSSTSIAENHRSIFRSVHQLPSTKHELRLVVKRPLDRESKSVYQFTLTAFDGGSPGQNASIPLHVVITDANDNSPRFHKETYVVELAENSRPHTPVVQVSAVDADEGVNGRIKYRFSSLTKPEFMRLFTVDSVTGWVHVQWEIDYEMYKTIILTVEAVDGGQLPRASTCNVEVHVLDRNDHAPEIRFEPAYLTNYALVPENEAPGRLVAVFTASDRDSGKNGRVLCALADPKPWQLEIDDGGVGGGAGSQDKRVSMPTMGDAREGVMDPLRVLFKLQPMHVPFSVMYKLTTASTFDREVASRITVWIQCADQGEPPRNTSGSVTIRVTDLNDERPRFSRTTYYHNVREDVPIGATTFRTNATDADEGDNARLTYWLSGTDVDYFTVNEHTGQIMTRRLLDRETKDALRLRIHTADHGTPSLNASADILVSVTDVNDNVPQLPARMEFAIRENHTASRPVGRLTVTDRDLGRNAEVTFSQLQCIAHPINGLASDQLGSVDRTEDVNQFFIAKDGRIYLGHTRLDREIFPMYELTIRAEDHGVPRLSTTAVVVIRIVDVNDNAPTFIFPSATNNTIYVPRTSSPGTLVTRLLAVDEDAGENSQLTFKLNADRQKGANELFGLDGLSGEIRLKRSLDPEPFEDVQMRPSRNGSRESNETHSTVRGMKNIPEVRRERFTAESSYNLLVTATDHGEPSLKTSTILRVLFSPPFYPPPSPSEVREHLKGRSNNRHHPYSTDPTNVDGSSGVQTHLELDDDLSGLGILLGMVIAIGLFACLVLLMITMLLRHARQSRVRRHGNSRSPQRQRVLPTSTPRIDNGKQLADKYAVMSTGEHLDHRGRIQGQMANVYLTLPVQQQQHQHQPTQQPLTAGEMLSAHSF